MGPMNAPVRFRWAWWLLAHLSLGLGLLGVLLPGLPTVPFILLAAWAAMRGSPRLHAWLLAHRSFGPMIRNWQDHGAITRRSKVLAIGTMALAAVVLYFFAPRPWVGWTATGIMAIVAIWLWLRPEPPPAGNAGGT